MRALPAAGRPPAGTFPALVRAGLSSQSLVALGDALERRGTSAQAARSRGAKPTAETAAVGADGHIQPLLKQSHFLLAPLRVCLSNQGPGPSGAGLDGPRREIRGPALIK